MVINGSQQQWYARNSQFGEWTNAVWNQVFSGVQFGDPGAAPVAVDSKFSNMVPYLLCHGIAWHAGWERRPGPGTAA